MFDDHWARNKRADSSCTSVELRALQLYFSRTLGVEVQKNNRPSSSDTMERRPETIEPWPKRVKREEVELLLQYIEDAVSQFLSILPQSLPIRQFSIMNRDMTSKSQSKSKKKKNPTRSDVSPPSRRHTRTSMKNGHRKLEKTRPVSYWQTKLAIKVSFSFLLLPCCFICSSLHSLPAQEVGELPLPGNLYPDKRKLLRQLRHA